MTTYNPKTILRLYDDSDNYLSTAVVINTGEILEVKNSDGKEKKRYKTIDEWQATRPNSDLFIDATKSTHIPPIRKEDAYGFIDHCGFQWTQWLMTMIYEGAPHLRLKEEVVVAFNTLTELLEKYRTEISEHSRNGMRTPEQKYHACSLSYFEGLPWKGMPIYWKTIGDDRIRTEITEAYKVLYDLISKKVLEYLEYKSTVFKVQKTLRLCEKTKFEIECRIRKAKRVIEKEEADLKILNDKIAKLLSV